jgi:hypothetical protein
MIRDAVIKHASEPAFDPVADRTSLVYRQALNRCVEVRVVRMKGLS